MIRYEEEQIDRKLLMKEQQTLLQQSHYSWIDHSESFTDESAMSSFAMDDLLCDLVGKRELHAAVRTWVHDRTIVLGIQDARLPYIDDVIAHCRVNGYRPIIRNSGGLAVLLDKGVLNITLVFSEEVGRIDIDEGYEAMFELIRRIFPEVKDQIKAYEIVGSYCPGSFDLSIDGKKFAGISQRRIRQAVAVQIYLSVEGSGAERAAFIRSCYEIGLAGESTKFAYPQVKPEVMASLSELLGIPLTVTEVVERLYRELEGMTAITTDFKLTPAYRKLFTTYLERMEKRNEKLI